MWGCDTDSLQDLQGELAFETRQRSRTGAPCRAVRLGARRSPTVEDRYRPDEDPLVPLRLVHRGLHAVPVNQV